MSHLTWPRKTYSFAYLHCLSGWNLLLLFLSKTAAAKNKNNKRKVEVKDIKENIFPLRKRQRCKKFQTDGKASADISTTSDCQVEKGGRHGG